MEIVAFLTRLDAEPGVTPRTVNKHRQVLSSIFEYAMREETFGLPGNPVRGVDKRREPDATPIDFYEAEEVFALARAAAQGLHPVSVKSFMGHSKITTTERHLHARSRRTDALRLTKAFVAGDQAIRYNRTAVT